MFVCVLKGDRGKGNTEPDKKRLEKRVDDLRSRMNLRCAQKAIPERENMIRSFYLSMLFVGLGIRMVTNMLAPVSNGLTVN